MRIVRFYPDDFLAGVVDMEPDERGVYITLLALLYSRDGIVIDDDAKNARLCGCSTRKYRVIKQTLLDSGKINDGDGYLSNDRASQELERAAETSDRQRNAAENRWKKTAKRPVKTAHKPLENEPNRRLKTDLNSGQKSDKSLNNNKTDYATAYTTGDPCRLPITVNNYSAGALLSESEGVREDAAAAFRMWNDLAKSVDHVPPCEAITETRQRKLYQVLSQIGGLEGWSRLLEKLGESEYFRARLVTGFKPGIDWVLSDANYPKILEGNYDQSFENKPKTPELVVRREASQWIERMNGFRESGFWTSNWGPRPGEDGCEVPDEFLSTEAAE